MALMDMILEAVSPTPDADFVKAMNAMDRIDDQKFYSSMASMGEYASHKRAKDKTTNKISVDQYLFQMEQQEAVREQVNRPDKTLDPATEEWDNYFAALENELNAIPIVDRTGEDPDVNHPNTQVLIEESDPEREDLPVNPLDEIAPPEDSDDEDYAEVMATESATGKMIRNFRKNYVKEMKAKIVEARRYIKETDEIDPDAVAKIINEAITLANEAETAVKNADIPDTILEKYFGSIFSLVGLPHEYRETRTTGYRETTTYIRQPSVRSDDKNRGKRKVLNAITLFKDHCQMLIRACNNVKRAPAGSNERKKEIRWLKSALTDMRYKKGVSMREEKHIYGL